MSGIRLETLVRAHAALAKVWQLPSSDPRVSYELQRECMEAAVSIKAQLDMLNTKIEVVPA